MLELLKDHSKHQEHFAPVEPSTRVENQLPEVSSPLNPSAHNTSSAYEPYYSSIENTKTNSRQYHRSNVNNGTTSHIRNTVSFPGPCLTMSTAFKENPDEKKKVNSA